MNSYITVSGGNNNYFAVMMVYDDEIGDYTPYASGTNYYGATAKKKAKLEAERWGEAEGIEVR